MLKPREKVVSARAAAKEVLFRRIAHGSGRKSALKLDGEILMRMIHLCFGGMEEELAYVFGVSTGTVSLTEMQDLLTVPNLFLNISLFKESKAPMLESNVNRTQKIVIVSVRVRIHVRRAIGRV